jgi:hypothetical protein
VIGTDCIGSCKSNYPTIYIYSSVWLPDIIEEAISGTIIIFITFKYSSPSIPVKHLNIVRSTQILPLSMIHLNYAEHSALQGRIYYLLNGSFKGKQEQFYINVLTGWTPTPFLPHIHCSSCSKPWLRVIRRYMSWSLLFLGVNIMSCMRCGCSFCWYLWNCWPSLFTFERRIRVFTIQIWC